MTSYSIENFDRRLLLKMSTVIAGWARSPYQNPFGAAESELRRTPGQILGPFYPLNEWPQTTRPDARIWPVRVEPKDRCSMSWDKS